MGEGVRAARAYVAAAAAGAASPPFAAGAGASPPLIRSTWGAECEAECEAHRARPRHLTVHPDLLELPLGAAHGAHVAQAQPALDALEVEAVVANAPRDGDILDAAGLVLDAGLVEAIAANGAHIQLDLPRPERHRIPLLELEAAPARARGAGAARAALLCLAFLGHAGCLQLRLAALGLCANAGRKVCVRVAHAQRSPAPRLRVARAGHPLNPGKHQRSGPVGTQRGVRPAQRGRAEPGILRGASAPRHALSPPLFGLTPPRCGHNPHKFDTGAADKTDPRSTWSRECDRAYPVRRVRVVRRFSPRS